MGNVVARSWGWLKRKAVNAVLRATVKPLWARSNLTVPGLQRRMDLACALLPPIGRAPGRPEGVSAHCTAEFFDAPVPTPRVLLYLHGGAWITHAPALYRHLARRLARLLPAQVLLPDYRLAPAHRFPAGSDDALAAYRHLLARGVAPHHIVIGGDSAGGNLALVTLMRARDEGLPLPACGFMFSPVTDLALTGDSAYANAARDVMFSPAAAPLVSAAYLERPELAEHPWVSPLRGEVHGLPPLLLQASASEMLADDASRFARRVNEAGGQAQFQSWPDLPHVFQLASLLSESGAALREVVRFVRPLTPDDASPSRPHGDKAP